jgi:hypothetical protein
VSVPSVLEFSVGCGAGVILEFSVDCGAGVVLEFSVGCGAGVVLEFYVGCGAGVVLATVLLSSAKTCCEDKRVGPNKVPSASKLIILLYFTCIPHFLFKYTVVYNYFP